MKECPLCKHEHLTHHYYEDNNIWIADCTTCNVPILVWKKHVKDLPKETKDKLVEFVKKCFGDQIKIRWLRRKIKDHFHFHILNVKENDLHKLKCKNTLELIESTDIEPIVPKVHQSEPKNCLILVPPHGRLIWEGTKKAIVKTIRLKEHIGERLYLICRNFCYGIITLKEPREISEEEFKKLEKEHRISEEEREEWCQKEPSWCKGPYYLYEFTFEKYPIPVPIKLKVIGPQVFVKKENVEFLEPAKLDTKNLTYFHLVSHAHKIEELHSVLVTELKNRGYPHLYIDSLDRILEIEDLIKEKGKDWVDEYISNIKNYGDRPLGDDHRIVLGWYSSIRRGKKLYKKGKKGEKIPITIDDCKRLDEAIVREMIRRHKEYKKKGIDKFTFNRPETYKKYARELFEYVVKKIGEENIPWKEKLGLPNLSILPPDMTIRDIDVQYVVGLTDKELIELWKYLTKQPFNEDVFNAGVFVGIELYKRGLWEKYMGNSKLANEVKDEVMEYASPGEAILKEPEGEYITLEDVLKAFPPTFRVEGQPWAAYVAGRIVNEGKIPKDHDIDLVFRQLPDPRVIIAVKNLEPKWLFDRVHVVFDPHGPCVGNNIPIYQYGFFKTSKKEQIRDYGAFRELTKVEPIMRFRLLKQKSGWEKNEFFDFDSFYKNWASKYLDTGILASKKYDGRAFSVQKKGDKIALITEDQQRDRVDAFPLVAEELRTIPHDFIFHAELVAYDCKGKEVKSARLKERTCEEIPREDFAWATVGKVTEDQQKSIVLHVHDAIYIDKDIHNLPYEERFNLIKKVLPDKYQFIRVVESSPKITNLRDLKRWVYKLRTMKGSEGAFFRVANATYPIKKEGQNRSPLLAKIKNLKSIDVMVWNRIPKKTKEGKILDQYMYDCVYAIPCNLEKEFSGVVHYNGKCYAPIGRSYATSDKNERGDIIEVLVGRIRKYQTKEGIRYTWMFPKYREKRTDKKEPDTLDTVKKLAKVGPGYVTNLSTVIRLKMCPYYKEEWCPLRKIFRVPRSHILSDTKMEYLKYPIICELANIYKCWYIKSYYYGIKDIIKEG